MCKMHFAIKLETITACQDFYALKFSYLKTVSTYSEQETLDIQMMMSDIMSTQWVISMRSLVHTEYSLTEEHMTGDETSGTILNVTNPSSNTCSPSSSQPHNFCEVFKS
jgi:hypothetical protein